MQKIYQVAGVVCVLAAPFFCCQAQSAEQNLPATAIPPFQGERYRATVPDTLDLAERLKLSLNGITRCVDECCPKPFPPTKYLANHFILLEPEGPTVLRNVNLYGKAMLGALLARMVTGSEERIDVDDNWRASWLEWQKIDPIMHGPEGGRRMEWIAMNIRRETGTDQAAWRALADPICPTCRPSFPSCHMTAAHWGLRALPTRIAPTVSSLSTFRTTTF